MIEVYAALILFLGSLLQTTIGFGLGLFALPLLLFCGLNMPQAVILISMTSFFQATHAAIKLRKSTPWRDTLFLIAMRMLTIPVGVYFLEKLSHSPIALSKQIVGVFILTVIIIRLVFKVSPREVIAWPITLVTFSLSGFLAGCLGMGGPPIVLWATAKLWSPLRIRSYLLTTFSVTLVYQVGILFFRFPEYQASSFRLALIAIPALLAGTWIGLHFGRKINAKQLRVSAYTLLTIIALAAIVEPLF